MIERRDGVILQYDLLPWQSPYAKCCRNAMTRWKASSKRVHELKRLMHSFKDVKIEGEFLPPTKLIARFPSAYLANLARSSRPIAREEN